MNLKELLTEAIFLLSLYGPSSCSDWKYEIGDCNRPECNTCRVFRCIDNLEDFISKDK